MRPRDAAAIALALASFRNEVVNTTNAVFVAWVPVLYSRIFDVGVICNDLVLVPSYTNSSVTQHNAEAIAGWKAACPDKTIVPIPCQNIVTSAGVMHCICMHIPEHKGGESPTMYLQTPNGGATYEAGAYVPIAWLSDDDEDVVSVAIQLSTDDGSSWTTVVENTDDDGLYIWNVPDV